MHAYLSSISFQLLLISLIILSKVIRDFLFLKPRRSERQEQEASELISMVSHEVRAPITNIKMASKMARIFSDRPEKLFQYLKIIEHECDNAISLINLLLDFDRITAKQWEITPEIVDICLLAQEVTESFESIAKSQLQTLCIEVSDEMCEFRTDRVLIGRIIRELLNNACKYTPSSGTITATFSTGRLGLQIQVSNSGVEISPDNLDRIFEKFYRVQTNHKASSGSGLGLPFVQSIVELLDGEINVKSCDLITTFTVAIPPMSQNQG